MPRPDNRPPVDENRLKGVMAFRVLLVTLFLGGTVAVDVDTFASLSDPRNVVLLSLTVLTYVLTLVYAAILGQLERLRRLARVQFAADFAVIFALVFATGGLDSIFLFLFYVHIITTAVVLGRSSALYAAGTTSLGIVLFGLLAATEFGHPLLRQLEAEPPTPIPIYFEVTVNCVAALLVALLSGQLSERLGRQAAELERRETDLRELRALTDNILASLDSGVLTVDQTGEIIYFNRAATAITGWSPEEVDGRPLEELSAEMAAAVDEVSEFSGEDTRRTGTTFAPHNPRFETAFKRPDGQEVFLGFSVSPLRQSDGMRSGHIVVFQDLTDIKRLQAEKERSQRLAAVGELAASIAHEIRNPLASISGSVEMLESLAELDDESEELMEIVVREVERLDDLIGEFLEFSQPTTSTPTEVDLVELVEDVLELFENRKSNSDVNVRFDAPDGDDWTAEMDRESIRQVLWNLLVNGVEAASETDEENPTVEIELRRDEDATPDELVVVVEDSGPGVPEETKDRIFEPFFTMKKEGTGLGLAVCHRTVEAHEGRLVVDDAQSLNGARFEVHLPESQPAGTTSSEHDAIPTRPQNKN